MRGLGPPDVAALIRANTLDVGRRRFVPRMSNAICGALVPRVSLRSSGLHSRRWTGPLRSPHEQRDMRGLGPPDVAALIRANTLDVGRRRFVARMSNAICGALVPRMSLRSSGLTPSTLDGAASYPA